MVSESCSRYSMYSRFSLIHALGIKFSKLIQTHTKTIGFTYKRNHFNPEGVFVSLTGRGRDPRPREHMCIYIYIHIQEILLSVPLSCQVGLGDTLFKTSNFQFLVCARMCAVYMYIYNHASFTGVG